MFDAKGPPPEPHARTVSGEHQRNSEEEIHVSTVVPERISPDQDKLYAPFILPGRVANVKVPLVYPYVRGAPWDVPTATRQKAMQKLSCWGVYAKRGGNERLHVLTEGLDAICI